MHTYKGLDAQATLCDYTDISTCRHIKICWEDWRLNYFYNHKKKVME